MDEKNATHRGSDGLRHADHPDRPRQPQGREFARSVAADAASAGSESALAQPARPDSDRPLSVPGPLGKPITLESLPPPDTRRWVVRRKAEVIAAIRGGLISAAEACARYRLSPEELELWQESIDRAGVPGLRVTRIQIYKDYVAPTAKVARKSDQDGAHVRDLSRSWGV